MALSEEVVERHRLVYGPKHPFTIGARHTLSHSYDGEKRLELHEETVALSREALGPEHSQTLNYAECLATVYSDQGRDGEALALREEILKARIERLGSEHPDTRRAKANLAASCIRTGNATRSMKLREEAHGLSVRLFGKQHPGTLLTMANLAYSYHIDGQRDRAIALRRQVLDGWRKIPGAASAKLDNAIEQLRWSYLNHQHPDTRIDGLKYLAEVDPENADLQYQLGKHLYLANRHEEALVPLRKALDHYSAGDRSIKTRVRLYRTLENLNRHQEAEALREELVWRSRLVDEGAPEPTHILVAPASEWRWFHPIDGMDPKLRDYDFHRTFFIADFDDSEWQSARDSEGPTGGFGYGDDWFGGVDIGKPKSRAVGHTAYFRTRFTTLKSHHHLELSCQRDDGIIVYLNGKEVARDNMAPGVETYLLPAASTVRTEDEQRLYRVPLKLNEPLGAGEHVLAISLHNTESPSSDLRIGEISLFEVSADAVNSMSLWEKAEQSYQKDHLRFLGDDAARRLDFVAARKHFEDMWEVPIEPGRQDHPRIISTLAYLKDVKTTYQLALIQSNAYADSNDPDLRWRIARSLMLLPTSPNEPENVSKLREEGRRLALEMAAEDGAEEDGDFNWTVQLCGRTHLRTGHYDLAEEWLTKALAHEEDGVLPFMSETYGFRALARYHAGRLEQAKEDLAAGLNGLACTAYSEHWWNSVNSYLILREAWELIEGKDKTCEALERWVKTNTNLNIKS